jgi:hypothetical protein
LNTQNLKPVSEQFTEQSERSEQTHTQPSSEKKPFVEPVVSVPVDVLEATTFFQLPTIEASTV